MSQHHPNKKQRKTPTKKEIEEEGEIPMHTKPNDEKKDEFQKQATISALANNVTVLCSQLDRFLTESPNGELFQ